MFWGKKSTLKRDVKTFKEIIDQINEISDGFFSKSNAKSELKSISKTLYPNEYNEYDSEDWADELYDFSASNYWDEYEYLDEDLECLKEELSDAKAEGDKDYIKVVTNQINDLKMLIKFYKKDASELFVSRLHFKMGNNQKNDNESEKFDLLTKDFNYELNKKTYNLQEVGIL